MKETLKWFKNNYPGLYVLQLVVWAGMILCVIGLGILYTIVVIGAINA